jgi:tetratricopeptide (TPR) repeat protein
MSGMQKRPVRKLILIMLAIAGIGTGIAIIHYSRVNRLVDPRVREARQLYESYNEFAQLNRYDSIFNLMDRIEGIYSAYPHYMNSYETGVLHNNRGAAYLAIFLQSDSLYRLSDSLKILEKAETELRKSIRIYEAWLEDFEKAETGTLRDRIEMEFLQGLESYGIKDQEQFLSKRVKELTEAQIENRRRLSVSYTNLGIVKRHEQKYDSAAFFYSEAIDLWDRNLTAENNLNILFNKPLRKRRWIETLFPPEKDQGVR